MYKIQIDHMQTEIPETTNTGLAHSALRVHIVPDLGSDKEILSGDDSLSLYPFQHLTDAVLILIDRRAVNQSVAGADPAVHRFRNLPRVIFIRTEGSQSHRLPG